MKVYMSKDGYVEGYALIGCLGTENEVDIDTPNEEILEHFKKYFTSYKIIDGQLTLDEDRIFYLETQAKNKIRIQELKQYLADTDYIITKLQEAQLIGKGYNELMDKYSETLVARESARDEINSLEEA